jgi:predicted DNA-binding transcriptional regulator YafY
MDRSERFHIIDTLLANRRSVSFTELINRLGVSPATLKRDLRYMIDRLHAPIVFDRELWGYRFDKTARVGDKYALPGLWFSAEEIHALMTMQHLLASLDTGGLLGPHIQPLMARITGLMDQGQHSADEIHKHIRLISLGARATNLEHFSTVAMAVLKRQRLDIRFLTKASNEVSQRVISPQRLVHYRENWYLDAWCHLRKGLRCFAVDGIQQAEVLEQPAKEVAEATLDRVLGAGYGIFSGAKVKWATLRFSAERARWVALEQWHPGQKSHFEKDGRYVLQLPYSDDRELVMDILRHVPEVEVITPTSLKEAVINRLAAGLSQAGRSI